MNVIATPPYSPSGSTFHSRWQRLESAVMVPPVVWLASDDAAGVHDQRIIAAEFERWLGEKTDGEAVWALSSRSPGCPDA